MQKWPLSHSQLRLHHPKPKVPHVSRKRERKLEFMLLVTQRGPEVQPTAFLGISYGKKTIPEETKMTRKPPGLSRQHSYLKNFQWTRNKVPFRNPEEPQRGPTSSCTNTSSRIQIFAQRSRTVRMLRHSDTSRFRTEAFCLMSTMSFLHVMLHFPWSKRRFSTKHWASFKPKFPCNIRRKNLKHPTLPHIKSRIPKSQKRRVTQSRKPRHS